MIDTVLFDLDGTLLDTIGDITDSANFTTQSYGLSQRNPDQIMDCIGDGLIKLIERIMPSNSDPQLIDEALQKYRSFYAKNKFNKSHPYLGITEMLQIIKHSGLKVGVVTNKKESAAQELTDHYFKGLIDLTIGDDSVRPLKPDPAPILAAISKLGSKASSTVFVGDSEIDVLAAQNAGVPVIAVAYGYRTKALLKTYAPDFLADTTTALQQILITLQASQK